MIFLAHSDAELTDSQLDELANHLVNKRRELADMLDRLDLQIAAKDDCSLSDAADRLVDILLSAGPEAQPIDGLSFKVKLFQSILQREKPHLIHSAELLAQLGR